MLQQQKNTPQQHKPGFQKRKERTDLKKKKNSKNSDILNAVEAILGVSDWFQIKPTTS